jgi:hypothetical protein
LAISQLRHDGRFALYQALLADARFHRLLLAIDEDIAADCRAAGCSWCGGVLHSARFRRKPRGRPAGSDDGDDRRRSFCCAVAGCRKRATPPSLRFLGRKVYLAAVVTLVSAMQHGARAARRQLSDRLGVSRRTVARWRQWWLCVFAAGPFWKAASAAFMPPADPTGLPLSLLDRFPGTVEERLVGLLRLLAPITGGASLMRAF